MNYPRPQNDSGVGVHGSPNASFPIGRGDELARNTVADWKKQGISWAKLIVFLGEHSHEQEFAIDECVRNDIQVVLRLFVDKPYPGNTTPEFYAKVRESVIYWKQRGVSYYEIRNEPNLRDAEWESDDWWHSFGSLEGRARHTAQLFMQDAEVVIAASGIPLTPALAPGGHDDDERVWREMCAYWRAQGAHDLLRQCAIAVHAYTLNHPPTYPYDAINQAEWPGAHLWSGGQSNGFLKYRYAAKVFRDVMGFTLPVLSTEDGPLMWNRDDGRYPQIDEQVHQKYILEIADFMAMKAEGDFLCTAFWLYGSRLFEAAGSPPPWEKDSWVSPYGSSLPNRSGVELPVVGALKARGFKSRRKGVKWEWEGTMPPVYPDWLKDVSATLPKHSTLPPYQPRTAKARWVAIHHTASPPDTTVEAIARYHVETRQWPAVAYHIVVAADGTTYLTNHLEVQSYHVANHNHEAVALCFIGDATKVPMTAAQIGAGKRALAWLLQTLNLKIENVQGHGDFPNQTTACPGNLPTSQWWKELLGDAPPQPTLDPVLARAAAFASLGIALNPESAFYKEARKRALGRPVTGEIDLGEYRLQGFDKAVLACRIGDWGNMQQVEWL